jgi:hypothetical protein
MADYERSATFDAAPQATYDYLADPPHMPEYIATMTGAGSVVGEHLHVSADVGDRHEEGDAMFHADAAARRLEWGREGSSYRGWLSVDGDDGAETSTVTIHLRTHDDTEADQVERALDDTIANIERAPARS